MSTRRDFLGTVGRLAGAGVIASLLQAEEVLAAIDLAAVGGNYNFTINSGQLGSFSGTATVKKNKPFPTGGEGHRQIKAKAKVNGKQYSGNLTLVPGSPPAFTIIYFKKKQGDWHSVFANVSSSDGATIQGTYLYTKDLREGGTVFVDAGTILITKAV